MRSGLRLATGQLIAVIDGDGQMPVDDVVTVYRRISGGQHDLVLTYRITRGDGPVRWLLSYCFNASFRVLFPGLGARDEAVFATEEELIAQIARDVEATKAAVRPG